jgi:hypothetical protein
MITDSTRGRFPTLFVFGQTIANLFGRSVPVNAGLIVYTFGSVRFLDETYFVWVFIGITRIIF